MAYSSITTVAKFHTYREGTDGDGNYCDDSTNTIHTEEFSNVAACYEYVRRVCEHAADMGDGSSARLIAAFWTDTKEALSTEQLEQEAFEREEETPDESPFLLEDLGCEVTK